MLARIKGTYRKAFIPLIQSRAKHDLRIGSAGYGDGDYCGELTDVTGKLMHMLSNGYEEGVLVEYDGTAYSIMRSILASNYAYFNNTVPVIVEKVSMVSDFDDLNQNLKHLDDYYKFIEYINHYKAKILNEDELKTSKDPRDIKTLDFIKSIEISDEISSKAIEKYDFEKIIVWINIHGEYLPDGSIEILKIINNKLLKVSEKITASLGGSIRLLDDFKFKYITVFTDGTPYNLAKCGDKFWATKYAIGHFVEDEIHKVAAILLNLLMYSKGRKYPIKRILQVAPYASEHSMFNLTRQDETFATTILDMRQVNRKWALVYELINDKCDKDTVIEFGKNISWFNMHFGTHGSGSYIALGKNAELKLKEIMGFNLSHTLIDLNACQTYPFVGKELLSLGAAGGYATLFIVKDATADEIGKGVFNGTLENMEPAESLRENIEKVVKAGSDGISEFAYVHIGLPRLRPFVREILDSDEEEIQRMKYHDMLNIVRYWIKNTKKGKDACFQNFNRQKEEYLKTIAKDDRKERLSLLLDEGLLEHDQKSFNNAVKTFNKAYDEIKDIDDKTEDIRYFNIKSSLLLYLIRALCSVNRKGDANDKLKELEKIALRFPESEQMNVLFAQGLYNLYISLGNGQIIQLDGKLKELEKIALRFPESEQINVLFAQGLFRRSKVLGHGGWFYDANKWLKELEKIAFRFRTSRQINSYFMDGLYNLTTDYGRFGWIHEAEGNIKELEKIALQFPELERINVLFAQGLFNQSKVFSSAGRIDEAQELIKKVKKMALKFPESEQINHIFAQGLFKNSKVLSGAGMTEEVESKLNQNEKITVRIAKRHVNLTNDLGSVGGIMEAEEGIKEFEKIALRFPESEQISFIFANGLCNISAVLGSAGRIDEAVGMINKLENEALRFPATETINLLLAKGLSNLSIVLGSVGRIDEAEGMINKLENVLLRFPASKQINLLLAKGLSNFPPHLNTVSRIEEAEGKLKK